MVCGANCLNAILCALFSLSLSKPPSHPPYRLAREGWDCSDDTGMGRGQLPRMPWILLMMLKLQLLLMHGASMGLAVRIWWD